MQNSSTKIGVDARPATMHDPDRSRRGFE